MSHETRKTYADLTDSEMIQLFCLLLSESRGHDSDYTICRIRDTGDGPVKIVTVSDDASSLIRFGCEVGNVWKMGNTTGTTRLYNIFQFVDRCRKMGLTYGQVTMSEAY